MSAINKLKPFEAQHMSKHTVNTPLMTEQDYEDRDAFMKAIDETIETHDAVLREMDKLQRCNSFLKHLREKERKDSGPGSLNEDRVTL